MPTPLLRPVLHVVMLLCGAVGAAGALAAAPARVAVATNFAAPLAALQADFERQSGYRLLISAGSTGKLYAQIVRGAPFDLFLAADQERPRLLASDGLARAEPFVYARGRLVLWTRRSGQSPAALRERLETARERLAIANEKVAPYGVAAKQALTHMGLWVRLEPRLLRGENVGQAYALAATGNAPLALVAASLPHLREAGSQWPLPAESYEPVVQAGVLLTRGSGTEAAIAFAAFLRSSATQARLESWGYQRAAREGS